MNKILREYGRSWLNEKLTECTAPQRELFVRMYGHWLGPTVTIEKIVGQMDDGQIDNAMMQVHRTLEKNASRATAGERNDA